MGKPKSRRAKDRSNKRNNKKRKLGLKPNTKPHLTPQQNQNPTQFQDAPEIAADEFSDEDSDSSSPTRIHRLLEPYSKDQLISFLLDAAADDPDLLPSISAAADASVAHRKLFVHSLGWDTARETLLHAFEPFGPVEDCNVVVDKTTGRSKGFGFVLFRTRAAASRALHEPQKKINNRVAFCQLASIGPVQGGGAASGSSSSSASGSGSGADIAARRIYVSNVHEDTHPDKLKELFVQFGEIEAGPFGFNMFTGKSRGFALFVYKTVEGARRALEEPHKMFEGRLLHCQPATDPSHKGKVAATAVNAGATAAPPLIGAASQPVLAAMAAAQNFFLQGQNPAYAMLLGQNPLLAAAAVNPAAAAALNPAALATLNPAALATLNPAAFAALNPAAIASFNPRSVGALNPTAVGAFNATAGWVAPQSQHLGGVGVGGGAPSLLGSYGYGSQGNVGLQGLQGYRTSQLGQSATTRPGGSIGGFPSYSCSKGS